MKKSFLLVTTFGVLIAASLAFTNAEEARYKNLKILPKKITKDQMDVVMRHFNASLGVKCNFCHVYNQEQKAMDFASDGNEHKGIARQMMKMTQKLNKKYFESFSDWTTINKLEVSCYSCHNGKENPVSQPPAPQRPGSPTTAPASPTPTTQH